MRNRRWMAFGLGLVISTLLGLQAAQAADWTRFRGPDASGVVEGGVPAKWSPKENVLWRTALPGAGASSPIALGKKVFVTCYSGYGLNADNAGDVSNLTYHLVCVDVAEGKVLWDEKTKASLPEQNYRGFIALHGYASASPVTDGQTVYAFFGRTGVLAYNLDGKQLWTASVGKSSHEWGSGASPILFENLLIVNASIESRSLVALDKGTGKEVWRVEGIVESWSTPVIAETADHKKELVVSARGKVLGLNPTTGTRLWECAAVEDYVCASVAAGDGVVFVSASRQPSTQAIRLGGQGDVTKTHVAWTLRATPKVPTPLYHDGYVYWLDVKGVALCVDAKTGKVAYKERMEFRGPGDKVYASLVLCGGKLYGVSRQGGAVVFAEGSEFKELARCDLGDKSVFNATPAAVDGQLLLRSDRFLYCIGK